MPIYDYHCDHCGHAFSAVQRFADDAISVCPGCGKLPRRLLSNPALVFKGSGWYKTDSRGPEKKEGSKGAPAATDTVASTEESQKKATSDTSAPAAAPAAAAKTGDAAPAPAKKPEKAERASS